MKIELRNVHYSATLSEETSAFTATVYVDGVKAGTAENHGTGGSTNISPYALAQKLDAYAASLPSKHFPKEYGGGEYKQTGETIVDELLQAYLLRSDMKRAMRRRFLFTKPDGAGVYQTKALSAEVVSAALAQGEDHIKSKIKGADRILNCMNEDDAFTIYSNFANKE